MTDTLSLYELNLQSDQRQAGCFRIRLQQQEKLPGLIHCQKSADQTWEVIIREVTLIYGGGGIVFSSHPLCRLVLCGIGLETLVRLLSRAVGMTGTARIGWTSTPTDGQTHVQLRLKAAASACWEHAT